MQLKQAGLHAFVVYDNSAKISQATKAHTSAANNQDKKSRLLIAHCQMR